MADPAVKTVYQFEFSVPHIPVICITVDDGSWHAKAEPDGSKVFHFRHEDYLEELIVPPHTVIRTTRREVEIDAPSFEATVLAGIQ